MDMNNVDWGSTAGSLSYQPATVGALNNSFNQNQNQSISSGLGIYNKAFSLSGSGNQYTPDKSLGGTQSLGGQGFEAYTKPDLAIPHITSNDMMNEYTKQKNASYDQDDLTVKKDSDFGNQGKDSLWEGTVNNWNHMSSDQKMGTVNAGITMAGILANLFDR